MPVSLSPSRLSAWESCPRQFWFRVVDRVPGRTWAHWSLGNAVHRALHDWWDVPRERRSSERARELVARHWHSDGFRDHEQSLRWRSVAQSMVWSYLERLDPTWQPLSSERSLAVMLAGAPVNGRIDRLDEDPDLPTGVVVVDYKTGSSVSSADEARASRSLAIYAYLVRTALRRPCNRVELHHVPSGQVATAVHTEAGLQRHIERTAGLIREIDHAMDAWQGSGGDGAVLDEAFPVKTGPLCGFCEAWSLCSAGQATTPQRASWEGLAENP